MKYEPKKVFVIEDGGYREFTYAEYCSRCEIDSSWQKKFFLPLYGMLLEVSEQDYRAFYKAKRRQKYLLEQSKDNQDISIDMLATEGFKDRELLIDHGQDVAEQAMQKILLDKLRRAIPLLSEEERQLLHEIFHEGKSERELALKYGVSQVAIHKRKDRILDKLRSWMKI